MKTLLLSLLIFCLFSSSCDEDTKIINSPPEITSLYSYFNTVYSGEQVNIVCEATDIDGDKIIYNWSASGGSFNSTSVSSVIWFAPTVQEATNFQINVGISDSENPDEISESIIIMVIPVEPEEPEIHTLIIYPTDDAYVCSGAPEENYGTDLNLFTGKVDFGGLGVYYYYSYLKFSLINIPYNVSIEKAEIRLTTSFNNSVTKPTAQTILYGISDTNWKEETITYNNRPSHSAMAIAGKNDIPFEVTNIQSFDVTADFLYCQYQVYYSLVASSNFISTGSAYCGFYSKELEPEYGTLYNPVLYIEYTVN
jgi:hypothetical protein